MKVFADDQQIDLWLPLHFTHSPIRTLYTHHFIALRDDDDENSPSFPSPIRFIQPFPIQIGTERCSQNGARQQLAGPPCSVALR